MDRADRDFIRFVSWVSAHLLAYAAIAMAIRYFSRHVNIIEIGLIRSAGSLLISAVLLRLGTA
ncbi:MAG TPA: hypothetical protein PKW21_06210, partial [Rhabdaerophilum sp.]|nr:hypothetical protein [Rhabdaerophilum sp.]